MAKISRRTIRNHMLAIGLCASLAATSLGFASHAEAWMAQQDYEGGVIVQNALPENALADNPMGENAMSENAMGDNSLGEKERKRRR